jgi:hypothetical protein
MAIVSKRRNEYLSNRAWFRDVVGGQDLVLCHASALECLQLFVGYVNAKEIDVYAKEKGVYDNINYRILNNFEGIDIVSIGNLKCTSFNQTVNDMFREFDSTDEQALTEALSKYYYMHNESFDGLTIRPENMKIFNYVKEGAIEYYDEGVSNVGIGKTHVQGYRQYI